MKAGRWNPATSVPWSFAHPGPEQATPRLAANLGLPAGGCRATVEFRRGEEADLAIPEIDARWSSDLSPSLETSSIRRKMLRTEFQKGPSS